MTNNDSIFNELCVKYKIDPENICFRGRPRDYFSELAENMGVNFSSFPGNYFDLAAFARECIVDESLLLFCITWDNQVHFINEYTIENWLFATDVYIVQDSGE